MTRAALYARVSTGRQHVDAQLAQLRQVAGQRGWRVVAEHVDDGVSSRRRRPALEQVLGLAHDGEVDAVAVPALDRLARSTRELLELAEKLSSWGVDLISLREQIDTSSATGKLVFTVLAALAEFERELLRERTLVGLEAARRRGRVLGRPRVVVDTDEALALRERGVPWPSVARRLGTSESTVRRAVARRLRLKEALSKTSSSDEVTGARDDVPDSPLDEAAKIGRY